MKLRMWFFCRRIKRSLLQLYYNKYVNYARNSLAYNIFKMFMLIIVLLLIIFSIAPKFAHISFISDNIDSLENISAGRLRMRTQVGYGATCISCYDTTEITCVSGEGILVDDILYDSADCKIVFKPESKSYGGHIYLSPVGQDVVQLDLFSGDDLPPLTPPNISIDSMSSDFSIKCNSDLILSQKSDLKYSFRNGSAFLETEDGVRTQITEFTIKNSRIFDNTINSSVHFIDGAEINI